MFTYHFQPLMNSKHTKCSKVASEKLWFQEFRISHIKAIKIIRSAWFPQSCPQNL